MNWKISSLLTVLIAACALQFTWVGSGDAVSFNRDIRPILNARCLRCHGGVKANGGFSLLFESDAFAETESGKPAIVRGKPGKSELVRRLRHSDPELQMPQESAALPPAEIELIERWIEQGAKWEKHWAFIPPEMPALPAAKPDAPTPIDRLVAEKLREQGLQAAPEADPASLLRRVALDLTGLPPTEGLAQSYLADPGPEAYARLVDSLLASPHFGERWAAMWMDLARYADSKGYERDPHRTIWPWRDWVIDAYNADMPFDQFTLEQLAGDLLPEATRDQHIATAFHRNSMTNTEGGTEDEEFRIAAVIDRLNTTYEVWQSLTISCVQCHSHPYDPIRHEDFYRSYAFFNTSQDADLSIDFPLWADYDSLQTAQIDRIAAWIQEQEAEKLIPAAAIPEDRIRAAVFPRLIPQHVDDFRNTFLQSNWALSNWSMNNATQKDKDYFFLYRDIPLDELTDISFIYAAGGEDARILVHLDSMSGPVIATADFVRTGKMNGHEGGGDNAFRRREFPVQAAGIDGTHDLVFEILNTSGQMPEGIVVVDEIYLHYGGAGYVSGRMKKMTDSLIDLRKKALRTPILREKTEVLPRATHLFERGNFLVPGKEVRPGIPGIYGEMPDGLPANRLGFARWLVSRDNPLTARVYVNRIWEQLFGLGIVETLEDMGTQGSPPTHPELLDYLSVRLMDEYDWQIKPLLREIVLSATYRRSSSITEAQLALDPYNRWLARGARFRLTAEQIRDQALAASGLLSRKLKGPSVMPVQPEGVWQVVYSGQQWETPDGPDRYRRGLYTYWKRTTPYPSMLAFDSPSREFCMSRRIRTNTPLQALVTLNDPAYLEAAQALAAQMDEAGGGDVSKAISFGYERLLFRPPLPEQLAVLLDLHAAAAEKLPGDTSGNPEIPPGEIHVTSPMALVAGALLNLDACLTRN